RDLESVHLHASVQILRAAGSDGTERMGSRRTPASGVSLRLARLRHPAAELGSRPDVQLQIDAGQVGLHCLRTDEKGRGAFRVGRAASGKPADLLLSRRQLIGAARLHAEAT